MISCYYYYYYDAHFTVEKIKAPMTPHLVYNLVSGKAKIQTQAGIQASEMSVTRVTMPLTRDLTTLFFS